MEFKECLFKRRSIRNFTDEEISEETIKEIINAGIYAPNACNFEAWKFIVIDKNTPNKKDLYNYLALKSPYGILVTYRNDLYVSGRAFNDYYQSAAAAIENMLLYITSIDLGAVWICGLSSQNNLRKAFNIPKNFDVIAYIAFGHPVKDGQSTKSEMEYHYGDEVSFKEHKRRFNMEQVYCKDKFTIVDNDCTYAKYPTKSKLRKQKCKAFMRNILKKLHIK